MSSDKCFELVVSDLPIRQGRLISHSLARRSNQTYLAGVSIPGPERISVLRSNLEIPQLERCRQWLGAREIEREPRRLDEDVHIALVG